MSEVPVEPSRWGTDRWIAVVSLLVGVISFVVAVATIFLATESSNNAKHWLHAYGLVTLLLLVLGLLVAATDVALRINKKLKQVQHENKRLEAANEELSRKSDAVGRLLTETQARVQALEQAESSSTANPALQRQIEELERQNAALEQQLAAAQEDHKTSRESLRASEDRVLAMDAELKRRPEFKKYDTPRWDLIVKQQHTIKFGHIKYAPFLRHDDDHEGKPAGPGMDLLRELLEGFQVDGCRLTLDPDPDNERDWTTIFEGLDRDEYQVVATPLFSTFSRTKTVSFTSPLFFSNIGLYVHASIAERSNWRRYPREHNRPLGHELRVDDLQNALGTYRDVKLFAVRNEISEGLAQSHNYGAEILPVKSGYSLKSLFQSIAREPRAMFCESYFAARLSEVERGEVVNVLQHHQFLYPVCFAVRFADYQLINLLNMRMLELNARKPMLQRLFEALKGWKPGDPPLSDATTKELKKHFVAEWPCSIDFEKGTEVVNHA